MSGFSAALAGIGERPQYGSPLGHLSAGVGSCMFAGNSAV